MDVFQLIVKPGKLAKCVLVVGLLKLNLDYPNIYLKQTNLLLGFAAEDSLSHFVHVAKTKLSLINDF